MKWIRPLTAAVEDGREILGSKAYGLIVGLRLGLPIPPGFVITTEACRDFLRTGEFPDGLDAELIAALGDLAAVSDAQPTVSVRSGSSVSMPGMMRTILNLRPATIHQLKSAVADVFASWDTPRAQTYREIHDIPADLGTAVVVQTMVFGDRDDHSGSGVAFSRDPNTGERTPYGEVLFGHQGDDVVSGRSLTQPLCALAQREPPVWARLMEALSRIEDYERDACSLEFTYESGELWILQLRPGRFVGPAAIRVATELVDEGRIGRSEALRRVSPYDLERASQPRITSTNVLARGIGACPGVAVGRIATTPESAVQMAEHGPVILVRPETSPLDMHGLAAAAGIITARGGPASHAAVVARSMGKPAVVGVADLTVDIAAVMIGDREIPVGELISIDGSDGQIVFGEPLLATDTRDPHLDRLLEWADEDHIRVQKSENCT
jgi:pyruvate,orthophosphate dikinase